MDEEEGTGTQILRFKCNGTPYEFRGEAYYDWMDMKVIDFMNEIDCSGLRKVSKTLLFLYKKGLPMPCNPFSISDIPFII